MGMERVESKRLRLKCTKIALRYSYYIYQCRKLKAWVVPLLIQYLQDFPANEPPRKQKQTDHITAESTAGELNSGYGVYVADLITGSIPDETAILSDGPIMIRTERSAFA